MIPLFPVSTDKMNMTPTNETSLVSDEILSSTIMYDLANLMEFTGWNSPTNKPSNTIDNEKGGTKAHYFGIIFIIVSLVLMVALNTLVHRYFLCDGYIFLPKLVPWHSGYTYFR